MLDDFFLSMWNDVMLDEMKLGCYDRWCHIQSAILDVVISGDFKGILSPIVQTPALV